MNKILSYAVSFAIVLALPGLAMAKDKNKAGTLSGKVTAVDMAKNTITVEAKKTSEAKTFDASAATITVDGESANLAAITAEMSAKVTVGSSPDTASTIEATSHKKGKKGKSLPATAPST